jgi:hypothetical protein
MSSGLLIFCGLAHDAQSGSAEILARLSRPVRLTDMLRECYVYGWLCVCGERVSTDRTAPHLANESPMRREFRVLEHHGTSLRRPLRRSTPVEIKRHHYRMFCSERCSDDV